MSAETRREGSAILVTWQEHGIGFAFDRIRETDANTFAVVRVESVRPPQVGPMLAPVRLSLFEAAGRERFAKALDKADGSINWSSVVESTIALALQEMAREDPPVEAADIVVSSLNVEYLFGPILPRNETTLLVAWRSAGKSMLAQMLAASLASGRGWANAWNPGAQGPILYLDWETHAEGFYRRLVRVCNGLELPSPARGIYYRRMAGPITHSLDLIRRWVDRYKPILTIVDSLGWAAGGDLNKSEVAIPTMDGIGSLPGTKLVLAHHAKEGRDAHAATPSAHGSSFFEAGPRSVLLLRRQDETTNSGFAVSLAETKASDDELRAVPYGLRYQFDRSRNSVAFLPASVEDTPDLAADMSLSARLRHLLRREGPLTYAEIAELTGNRVDTIRKTITRMADVVRVSGNGTSAGGRGNEQKWMVTGETRKPGNPDNLYIPTGVRVLSRG